jgi:Outer membrane protein beta-barrel domain
MIKRSFFLVFCSVLFSFNSFAQENWGGGVDYEWIHFGFTFQKESEEYKILKKPSWRDAYYDGPVDPKNMITDELYSISSPISPGFGLGFVSNLRLGDNADLRFTPTIVFSDRLLNYTYKNPEQDKQKIVQSTSLDFPMDIKIKSDRRKNFRAYLIGGAKYSIDIVSKKKVDDAVKPLIDKLVKNNRNTLWYEAGFGFDLYFEFFKLSPEIKLSHSFQSVLRPEDHPYSSPIDKLFLRNLQFSLYFE